MNTGRLSLGLFGALLLMWAAAPAAAQGGNSATARPTRRDTGGTNSTDARSVLTGRVRTFSTAHGNSRKRSRQSTRLFQ
jgi:hypothetical protein